jgi:D-tagatose-1,6-bisphosphate aldolase subunit GatZ/KbaZ
MRLASDSKNSALSNITIAERSARLCAVAEKAFAERKKKNPNCKTPVYVIGSEVPIPGGTEVTEDSVVTSPSQCQETYETFKEVYGRHGLSDAFNRVLALVVQTGAEFGDSNVSQYKSDFALSDYGKKNLPFLFEGHSTDYQLPENLKAMVQDGIAILKVGPALTFALREALFGLEQIEEEFFPSVLKEKSGFAKVLEQSMLDSPKNWKNYYHGSDEQIRLARKYSYSDRARYYLNGEEVEKSLNLLLRNINSLEVPPGLFSQYLPREYDALIRHGMRVSAEDLIYQHIGFSLEGYYQAVKE